MNGSSLVAGAALDLPLPSPTRAPAPATAAILHELRARVGRPRPFVPSRIDSVPDRLRDPLVLLLQRFQLGEAGEGRVASEARRSDDPALDDALREATALYVREEGRHAIILRDVLHAMGRGTIKEAAAEALFRRGRRLLGFRTKMLVIASAEVVGIATYRAVSRGVVDPSIVHAMEDIVADEWSHLDYQSLFFSRVFASTGDFSSFATAVVGVSFPAILAAAALLVAVQNRGALRELGTGTLAFLGECALVGGELARATIDGGRSVRCSIRRPVEPGFSASDNPVFSDRDHAGSDRSSPGAG